MFASIEVASRVISSKGEISGAIVSTTVISCVRLKKLFEESMAVHVTVVSPNGKTSGASFVIEAISPLIEKGLPGFGELFRQLSYEEIGPLSIASRSMAGIAGYTPIFCLPGSSNAVKLGVGKIILPVCGHTVEQARRGRK